MPRMVICPGSFDPITKGHEDIIRRAAALFDQVRVLVSTNPEKNPIFSAQERMELIRDVCKDLPNVEVDSFNGLLVDYLAQSGAVAIVKGLRAVSDFDYEFQQAMANRAMQPQAETIFLTPNVKNMFLSSSVVRQIARFGGDIRQFVPACVVDRVVARMTEANRKYLEKE